MKISQEEIDAAWTKFNTRLSGDFKEDMRASLEAAYTVRKQRKAAKRERQRKEKDKQVAESVKAAAWLKPDDFVNYVDVIRPQLKEAIAKVTGIQDILRGDTPSKAPEWDGTFGVGEWEMRNGKKTTIVFVDAVGKYPLKAKNGSDYATNGTLWDNDSMTDLDLIRPWQKSKK